MATFVRVAAVLVGMLNLVAVVATAMWFAATGAEELEGLNAYHLLAGLCVGTIAGLLTAEILLRLAPGALRGAFFSRYAVTVIGLCLGGALAMLLTAFCIALAVDAFHSLYAASRAVFVAAPFVLWGGVAGLIEGFVLGFPLAIILGRFRTAG